MIGKVLGERYEIIEKIGGGGMALVYKARCRLLNRFVAIKVLRPEFTSDEDFIKKFKRESQAAASLSHPNIVGIYDVGLENDIHYIVMEYIKGQTLKDLIKQKGSLNIEFATNIAIQIASALENAHNNHIVHRDIKSHNIMLKEDRTVKVTDFGIARAVSSCTITNTGNIIGSVHYFSPEQARGGFTDEKSDIYSLGVVIYELVTGRLPFEGETPISVALKHVQEEPIKPSEINDKTPKSLEDIILKCMSKDISKRYGSAGEIINDLKQSLLMPNGGFVRNNTIIDEDTIKIEAVKEMPSNGKTDIGNGNESKLSFDKGMNAIENSGKKGSKKFLYWTITSGLILAIMFVGAYFLFKNLLNVDIISVPNLMGMQEDEAEKELRKLGFIMDVAERVHNKDVPEGEIIRQDPKPDQSNKVTNPVTVFVSKGPRKIPVPPIIGKNYDEVDIILESVGLEEGDVKQEYSQYPSGIVIDQKIAPGISVDEGTRIDYVISGGPEKIFLDSFIGKNIDDVETQLIMLDLIRGSITEEYSEEYAKGIVIDQSVSAGTEISKKSVIDFVVSKGKKEQSGDKLYYLSINLPKNLDRMKVTVFKIESDKSILIYENTHSSSDSPLKIEVNGKGNVLFEVYINNSFHESTPYKF